MLRAIAPYAEIFRRLGLAEEVRNAGLPADYPHDVSYRTSFVGKELKRIRIPCRRDRFTAKGCRTPHLWCADGRSLYDAMGPEFTLLRFDPSIDVAPLGAAARERGLPLKILDIDRPAPAKPDVDTLVLSRPDQHVAWRSNRLPADCLALIDRVRGAAIQARE